uniref:Calponin-homology (CH) domain-containing protein n=2 Tax=Pseudonaja textilis TaxID=8673 RepID=A0A670ZMW5_PSETE
MEWTRREGQLAALHYEEEKRKTKQIQKEAVLDFVKLKASQSPRKQNTLENESDDRSTISSNSPTSQTVHLSAPYPGPAATPSYRATPQRPESFLFRNSAREDANKAVTSLPASSSAPVNCTDDLSDNHNSTLPEEDVLVIEQLRKNIESRLKVSLPNDLSAALTDGVVLCHLANHVRPRSVPSIHVPSPAVPKLTIAKCRRNVENFLEACRKIGVPQERLCLPLHILEEKGLAQVAETVQALLEWAPPKQQHHLGAA